MGILVKNKHLNLYKKYTEQLIQDLGKDITIFLKSKEMRCGNCKYDALHKCSSGIYNGTGPKKFSGMVCPVCKGAGFVHSSTSKTLNAICRWCSPKKDDEQITREKFGEEEELFLKVKTKVIYYDDFCNAEYFMFEGERYRMKNIIKRGMKTNVVCVAYLEKENV